MVIKKKKTVAKKTERKTAPHKYSRDEQAYRESLRGKRDPSTYKGTDAKTHEETIMSKYSNIDSPKIYNKIKHMHDNITEHRKDIDGYYEKLDGILNEIKVDNHYFTEKDNNTKHIKRMLKDMMDDLRRAGRSNYKHQRQFEILRGYIDVYPNFENIRAGASLEERPSRRDLVRKFGGRGVIESKAGGDFDERIIGEDIPEFKPCDMITIPKEVYRKSGMIEINIKRKGLCKSGLGGVSGVGKGLKLNVKKIDPKKMYNGIKLAGKK